MSRVNSLCPPYSMECKCAGAIVLFFICGVIGASELPPSPPPSQGQWLRFWKALLGVWSGLLVFILVCDPRARPPKSGDGAAAVQCSHGCIYKPTPKIKHCKKCGKCVEGFDHHCLWLNTCVGARNYRPWILFVAVLFLWVMIGSAISWSAFIRALPVQSRRLAVGHRPFALLTGLGTAFAGAWLLLLLLLHTYLTFLGLTTFEWIKDGGVGRSQAWRHRQCHVLRICERQPQALAEGLALPASRPQSASSSPCTEAALEALEAGGSAAGSEPVSPVPPLPSMRGCEATGTAMGRCHPRFNSDSPSIGFMRHWSEADTDMPFREEAAVYGKLPKSAESSPTMNRRTYSTRRTSGRRWWMRRVSFTAVDAVSPHPRELWRRGPAPPPPLPEAEH